MYILKSKYTGIDKIYIIKIMESCMQSQKFEFYS